MEVIAVSGDQYLVQVSQGDSPFDGKSLLVDFERNTVFGPLPTQSVINQGYWLKPGKDDPRLQETLNRADGSGLLVQGGKGSGNFGHVGRPGEQGGSGLGEGGGVEEQRSQVESLRKEIGKFASGRVEFSQRLTDEQLPQAIQHLQQIKDSIELNRSRYPLIDSLCSKGKLLTDLEIVPETSIKPGALADCRMSDGKITLGAWGHNDDGPLVIGVAYTCNSSYTGTFWHEVGHKIDFTLNLRQMAGQYPHGLWIDTKDQSKIVSVYGKTNGTELFAEIMSAACHPNYSPGKMPTPYREYISKVLKTGPKTRGEGGQFIIQGGPGSGNFGHGGRKGAVGGSSKEGGDKSTGKGDCYEAAGRYMMDHGIGQKGLTLVHGEVTGQGPIEGLKFGHSWLEKDGMVIDKANGRDLHMPMEQYYRIGKIGDNVHKYNYKQFVEKVLKTKTWGPWDLKTESGL
jgi:hypothetical protein